MTTTIDTQLFLDAGFTFEEILSIRAGLADIDAGRVYSEREAWEIISQKRAITQFSHA
jgi:hypothetical protein